MTRDMISNLDFLLISSRLFCALILIALGRKLDHWTNTLFHIMTKLGPSGLFSSTLLLNAWASEKIMPALIDQDETARQILVVCWAITLMSALWPSYRLLQWLQRWLNDEAESNNGWLINWAAWAVVLAFFSISGGTFGRLVWYCFG